MAVEQANQENDLRFAVAAVHGLAAGCAFGKHPSGAVMGGAVGNGAVVLKPRRTG